MSTLPKDSTGASIPVLRPTITHDLDVSAGSASTPPITNGVTVVRLLAENDVRYAINGVGSTPLFAGTLEFIPVEGEDVLTFVGSGLAYVTEMA